MPNSTLTLFGAENVRSKPARRTRLAELRNGEPSRGSRPASTLPKLVRLHGAGQAELEPR